MLQVAEKIGRSGEIRTPDPLLPKQVSLKQRPPPKCIPCLFGRQRAIYSYAMNIAHQKRARKATIRVGDARGFVVNSGRFTIGNPGRYVITAAHCLPNLPPAHPWARIEERTFEKLLGPLGDKPAISAECVFVDPTRDIAVLASPDGGEFPDEAEAYDQLVFHESSALRVGDLPESSSTWVRNRMKRNERLATVWLLHLDNEWLHCSAKTQSGCGIWLSEATKSLASGMSGSPCLSVDGAAVGVFGNTVGATGLEDHREGGPQARLTQSLPGWLLRKIQVTRPVSG